MWVCRGRVSRCRGVSCSRWAVYWLINLMELLKWLRNIVPRKWGMNLLRLWFRGKLRPRWRIRGCRLWLISCRGIRNDWRMRRRAIKRYSRLIYPGVLINQRGIVWIGSRGTVMSLMKFVTQMIPILLERRRVKLWTALILFKRIEIKNIGRMLRWGRIKLHSLHLQRRLISKRGVHNNMRVLIYGCISLNLNKWIMIALWSHCVSQVVSLLIKQWLANTKQNFDN